MNCIQTNRTMETRMGGSSEDPASSPQRRAHPRSIGGGRGKDDSSSSSAHDGEGGRSLQHTRVQRRGRGQRASWPAWLWGTALAQAAAAVRRGSSKER